MIKLNVELLLKHFFQINEVVHFLVGQKIFIIFLDCFIIFESSFKLFKLKIKIVKLIYKLEQIYFHDQTKTTCSI